MKGFHELSLVALSFLAYAVSAEEAQQVLGDAKPSESDVHVLTTDTFSAFIKERPHVLAKCKPSLPSTFSHNMQWAYKSLSN
jgi:hypothetical protein